MADFIAWSHSRRKTFMECPKAFYHQNVAKKGHPDRVEFVQSQAMRDGNEVDDALTKRISLRTPLPQKFAPYEPIAAMVVAAPGHKFTQMKLAFDQTMKPCGYMDWNTAWLRVIYDLAIVDVPAKHAFIWDWKNGQITTDEDQLKLFAATGFLYWPEIDTIDVSYIWLKHGIPSDRTYQRQEMPEMWGELLPDVERMQASFKANHWPATPQKGQWGWNCKRCSVNKAGKCDQAAVPPV